MIYLNDVEINAEFEVLSESYDKVKKYDVMTEDGVRHVKYVTVKHDVSCRFITLYPEVLKQIKDIVTSTNSYVQIHIPIENFEDIEYQAIVDNVSDEAVFIDDNNIWWGILQMTFYER